MNLFAMSFVFFIGVLAVLSKWIDADKHACCAPPPSCPDGVILYDDRGCRSCYANPCLTYPYTEDDGTARVCDPNLQDSCPVDFSCTSTETAQSVCCSMDITTTMPTTMCPPITDCSGTLVEGWEPCPVCIYFDTCIQIPCGRGYYCLVEDANSQHEVASCVLNPCGYFEPYKNQSGVTTLCTENKLNCPEEFVCTEVLNDYKERSVCCPPQTTTSEHTTHMCT